MAGVRKLVEDRSNDEHIRSSSSRLLRLEAMLTREDRPLNVRDRQQCIKERVRYESRLRLEVNVTMEAEANSDFCHAHFARLLG